MWLRVKPLLRKNILWLDLFVGIPLRTLSYTKDETKQKHLRSYSPYAFTVFASILATTGLLNWFTDLSVLYRPTHSPFLLFLLIFASLTAISTSVLWKVGLRFYQSYCPIGVYLAVTSQKHTMRIDFEPANCTLGEVCIHDCPMALDPRLPAMETENDTHTQCILCVGIALRHATLVLRKYPVRNRCSYERAFSLLKRSILPKYSSA